MLIGELRRTLPGLAYAPVAFISAKERNGLDELLDAVVLVAENLDNELPTGVLNRVLHRAFEQTPPPVVGNAPLKFFYASMVDTRPPKVKLFVNRAELAAPNYVTYLAKQLRNAFELEGLPLHMELCARPKKVESIRRHQSSGRKRK